MPVYRYEILPEYIGGLGRVTLGGIVKLFQRAATNHSDELGFTSEWYRTNNSAWMARRHRFDVQDSIHPNETVRVETEVEDFRRIRSLRTYTMKKEETGETVAEGYTDWVYLDRTDHSLKRTPQSMIEKFDPVYPDGSPNRTDFESPDLPGDCFTSKYRVQFRDLDELAHVNNVVYVEYVIETLLRRLTRSNKEHRSLPGEDFKMTNFVIQYLGQANWGDEITCSVDPREDPETPTVTPFHFEISNTTDRIVEGTGTWNYSEPLE